MSVESSGPTIINSFILYSYLYVYVHRIYLIPCVRISRVHVRVTSTEDGDGPASETPIFFYKDETRNVKINFARRHALDEGSSISRRRFPGVGARDLFWEYETKSRAWKGTSAGENRRDGTTRDIECETV